MKKLTVLLSVYLLLGGSQCISHRLRAKGFRSDAHADFLKLLEEATDKVRHRQDQESLEIPADTFDKDFALPPLAVNSKLVTASGISTGTTMSMQLLVSLSDIFAGA